MATLDQSKRADMSTLAAARQEAYSFLGSAFSQPPSADTIAAVRSDEFLSAAASLFSEETLAPFRHFAQPIEDVAELQRLVQQEFMNLLKVPGGQYVTPYESVYCDTHAVPGKRVKGLLMGRSAVDVQKWYRLAAVEIADERKELPDHIGVELGYLAHLCGKEQQFASNGDDSRLARAWEMQRDFLAAHIVSWVGALRDRIHERAQHAYFRAVADMLVEFAQRDLATLEELLGPSSRKSVPDYEAVET